MTTRPLSPLTMLLSRHTRRQGLDGAKLGGTGWYGGVPKDRHARHARRDLFEQFQPFSAYAVFIQHEASGVAARPRQAVDETGADWIGDEREHDRHGAIDPLDCHHALGARGEDDVGSQCDQFHCVFASRIGIACEPTIVNAHVAADSPAEFGEPLRKRSDAGRCLRIVCGHAHQRTDPPHSLALLRARRERPSRRAAKSRDELAPFHSITSSASASSLDGMSRPSALAATTLMTSSYLVGISTGRSLGFAPLRMRGT